jgi:hypothetical protein
MQDDNAAPVEADVRPSGEAPMLIGKSTIIFLVAAAMATPGIANAGSISSQCASLKADAARTHADEERMHQSGGRSSDPRWCASARDMIRIDDDMISIAAHDPSKCGEPGVSLEALETARTNMMAALDAAPCLARTASTSNPCASIKADAAKAEAEFKVIREAGRSIIPNLCAIAHNIIHVEEHSISIITHDPTRCGLTSDQIEYFEGSKAYWTTRAVGCP